MKKTSVILFLIFIGSIYYGQNTEGVNLDPEFNRVNSDLKLATTDTIKIEILGKQAIKYFNTNKPLALNYLEQALKIAEKTGNVRRIKRISHSIVVLYQNLGYELTDNGETRKALAIHYKGLEIAKKVNDEEMIAAMITNIGVVHSALGEYDKALEYDLKALRLKEIRKDLKGIAISNSNLGILYLSMLDSIKSLQYFYSSLKAFTEMKDSVSMAILCDDIGEAYSITQEKDKQLQYVLKAYEIRNRIKDTIYISYSYSNIAAAYIRKKRYDEAIEFYLKALSVHTKRNHKEFMADDYSGLASVYKHKGEYNNAIIALDKGLILAKETEDKGMLLFIYGLFSEIYELNKEYKKALDYHRLKFSINDTMFNADKNKKIAELQTQYETEKKEIEIEKLIQKNKIQELEISRNWYLIIGLISSVILIVVIAVLFSNQNKQKANQSKMEMEQKLFRSQMNPHFIFNALIAIQNYVYKHKPAEVAGYISSFAKLMRMTLENSRSEHVTIEKELSTLKYYLELQQLRFQDKFDFTIYVDPNIEVESISIPPTLSQPFIENAIEHGIMNKQDGKGKIDLKFIQREKAIELIITDNGVGIEYTKKMKSSKTSNHNSLATTITEERIAILNRKSKKKFELKIEDIKNSNGGSDGTKVSILIPES